MKSLIFSILCFTVAKVISKKALIFNLETRALADVCRDNGDQKCPAFLTACPAFTPHEHQFNKNMSLSKKSVFSRIIYAKDEYAMNIVTDFCEKTIEPVMLYNAHNNKYEIGYELYFEEGKINIVTDKTYHLYKRVNTKDLDKYEIMNFTIPLNDSLFVRYEQDKDMKFNFTDGSRTLVFYWINVLSVQSSKHKKRTKIVYDGDPGIEEIEYLGGKCENYYPSDIDDLYSKKNQMKFLKDIPVPASFNRSNADMECGHPYGCLEKSQMTPLWFFKSSLARLASCSHMNVIPVWTSIAKQLRKVDLYLTAVAEHLCYSDSEPPHVSFGVSGMLKISPPPSTVPGAPQKQQKMYLRSSEFKNKKVPIPRIIYRIIKITIHEYSYCDENYNAVIIIHNDPTADPKTDKLCINDTLSGWDRIINDDPRTGFTYVCPLTEDINKELGAFDNLTLYDIVPLNLDAIHYYSDRYTYPVSIADGTYSINRKFDDLMEQFV